MEYIAIFGGTFDPVHNGHIQTSLKIQSSFNFDHYYFLPCKIPLLKPNAMANNEQRIQMLQLALEKYPQFSIDLREIHRNSPSYMVDTLDSFRQEYPKASITLIIGYDSFLSLPQWHRWQHIMQLANLLVIYRPAYTQKVLPEELAKLIDISSVKNWDTKQHSIHDLNDQSGKVILFHAGNYDISSTHIRKEAGQNQDSKFKKEVPKEVYEYIKKLKLYQ